MPKDKIPLTKKLIYTLGTLTESFVNLARDIPEIADDPYAYCRRVFGGYSKTAIYQSITELVRVGYIEKVRERGEIKLKFTLEGKEKLVGKLPLSTLEKKPWDKKWRLVIFDISEEARTTRDNLRRKLKELTLGMWQKSVYITPHDITWQLNEFLESLGLEGKAFCFEADSFSPHVDKALARKVWGLDRLKQQYRKMIEEFDRGVERNEDDQEKLKAACSRFQSRYFLLLEKDPHLPKELLPEGWPRQEVLNAFRRSCKLFTSL